MTTLGRQIFLLLQSLLWKIGQGILDSRPSDVSGDQIRSKNRSSKLREDFSTSLKSKSEASTSYAVKIGQHTQRGLGSSSWGSPAKVSGESDDKAKGSPVEGVVQPCALAILPPQREVAGPEMQMNALPVGNLDEEEWVTVYGFSPGDTKAVLREFEKCGVILKHVPGPRDANWMDILYQNRSAAQKALSKNGMQINGVLIVGVKLVDPMECLALNKRLNNNNNNQGFMLVAPPSSRTADLFSRKASLNPYYLQNGTKQPEGGAIASPAKSVVSKIMDLTYGV